MTGTIVRRLLSMLPVMCIVAICVFLLLHLAPGDPAAIIAGENVSPENIARIRAQLGLDQPVWKQFLVWVWSLLHGDLGTSMFWGDTVTSLIGERAEPTISLAFTTLCVAVFLAIAMGVLAAARAGSLIDRLVMGFAVLGFSLPVFVVGYVLIFVFAINLRWLPVQGYTPISEGILPWLRNLALPSIALGMAYVALIARITRTTMLDVLAEDYMRTAKAKGVATRPMLFRHALKNAAVPIATIVGNGVALLIGGVVITETVFNIPGIGRLVVDAIARRDYPIIQGVIMVFSGMYVFVNLLVDVSYSFFDPRVRG
jgi:peptide/nickel transport system permease protein